MDSKKTGSKPLFIVVFDDKQGLFLPMAKDRDCEGAICAAGGADRVVLFTSRKQASAAINISAKFAALQKAQSKPANDDFLEARKCLRIIPCEFS